MIHFRQALTLAPIILLLLVAVSLGAPVTKVYVPSGTSNEVVIYGADAGNLIRIYNAAFDVDRAFSKPDNSEVWLVGSQTTSCEVVDASSDRQVALFDIELLVEAISFSPDGLYGFAVGYETRSAGRQVFAVDCENYEKLYPLTEVRDVGDVVVSADSRKVWVSSVSAGTIVCFELPSFEPIDTIFAGPEPVDLEIIEGGNTLLAVCRGLDMGAKGGAQIAAFSTSDGAPLWINNDLGSALSGVSTNDRMDHFVISYYTPLLDPPSNIREFTGRISENGLNATDQSHYLIGKNPQHGILSPEGTAWLGCVDKNSLVTINLETDSVALQPEFLTNRSPHTVALTTIAVDEELARINTELQNQATSDLVPERLLEYAYLQKTAGNNNDVVATYKRIIENYPASYAAIEAGLEMSKFSYYDNFYIQSAEYAVKAMATFADYLDATLEPRIPPMSDLYLTIERLALLSDQFGKDYLEDVAKEFLDLSAQQRVLADLFFDMGFHLYRIDEEGTARKCFSEVRNQLQVITDPGSVRDLSARLALATGDKTAYYRIKKMKNGPTLDGDLSEWKDINSIQLTAASGWFYGQAGWKGQEDLAGVMHVAYNESDLFLAGIVFDDSLVSGSNMDGDEIRFFVDLRQTAGSYFVRDNECTAGCYEFSIVAPSSSQPKARLLTSLQAPYEIASSRSADGYNFEIRMPLVAFGRWFAKDLKRIGLGIELIDSDKADDPSLRKALGFVLPSNSPGGPATPSLFGVAELQ